MIIFCVISYLLFRDVEDNANYRFIRSNCINQIQFSLCLFVYFFCSKKFSLHKYLPADSSGCFPFVATNNVTKNVRNTVSFIAISDPAKQDNTNREWLVLKLSFVDKDIYQDRSFAIKSANLIESQHYNKPPIPE